MITLIPQSSSKGTLAVLSPADLPCLWPPHFNGSRQLGGVLIFLCPPSTLSHQQGLSPQPPAHMLLYISMATAEVQAAIISCPTNVPISSQSSLLPLQPPSSFRQQLGSCWYKASLILDITPFWGLVLP